MAPVPPPQTVLIAVSGTSPAILTETIWALANETPAIVSDEVIVITTKKGEGDIKEMLQKKQETWKNKSVWETLRKDVFSLAGLPQNNKKLQLDVRVIHLPNAKSGVRIPADDVRTREDNKEAADFIVRIVDECTTNDRHVIASIAGGRKTMGALLYAAMSLRAKESDRITHVLINEHFDSCRGFFYPQQPVQDLEARPPGKAPIKLKAAGAKVDLADIPFVPLRNKFEELSQPRLTFSGLVDAYSKAERTELTRPPFVSLDEENGILTVEGHPFPLKGRELLVAAFLYERARQGEPHFASKHEARKEIEIFNDAWKKRHPFHQAVVKLSAGGIAETDISKALTPLRQRLVAAGLSAAIPYLAPDRSRIGFDISRSRLRPSR